MKSRKSSREEKSEIVKQKIKKKRLFIKKWQKLDASFKTKHFQVMIRKNMFGKH